MSLLQLWNESFQSGVCVCLSKFHSEYKMPTFFCSQRSLNTTFCNAFALNAFARTLMRCCLCMPLRKVSSAADTKPFS